MYTLVPFNFVLFLYMDLLFHILKNFTIWVVGFFFPFVFVFILVLDGRGFWSRNSPSLSGVSSFSLHKLTSFFTASDSFSGRPVKRRIHCFSLLSFVVTLVSRFASFVACSSNFFLRSSISYSCFVILLEFRFNWLVRVFRWGSTAATTCIANSLLAKQSNKSCLLNRPWSSDVLWCCFLLLFPPAIVIVYV